MGGRPEGPQEEVGLEACGEQAAEGVVKGGSSTREAPGAGRLDSGRVRSGSELQWEGHRVTCDV